MEQITVSMPMSEYDKIMNRLRELEERLNAFEGLSLEESINNCVDTSTHPPYLDTMELEKILIKLSPKFKWFYNRGYCLSWAIK